MRKELRHADVDMTPEALRRRMAEKVDDRPVLLKIGDTQPAGMLLSVDEKGGFAVPRELH